METGMTILMVIIIVLISVIFLFELWVINWGNAQLKLDAKKQEIIRFNPPKSVVAYRKTRTYILFLILGITLAIVVVVSLMEAFFGDNVKGDFITVLLLSLVSFCLLIHVVYELPYLQGRHPYIQLNEIGFTFKKNNAIPWIDVREITFDVRVTKGSTIVFAIFELSKKHKIIGSGRSIYVLSTFLSYPFSFRKRIGHQSFSLNILDVEWSIMAEYLKRYFESYGSKPGQKSDT